MSFLVLNRNLLTILVSKLEQLKKAIIMIMVIVYLCCCCSSSSSECLLMDHLVLWFSLCYFLQSWLQISFSANQSLVSVSPLVAVSVLCYKRRPEATFWNVLLLACSPADHRNKKGWAYIQYKSQKRTHADINSYVIQRISNYIQAGQHIHRR